MKNNGHKDTSDSSSDESGESLTEERVGQEENKKVGEKVILLKETSNLSR